LRGVTYEQASLTALGGRVYQPVPRRHARRRKRRNRCGCDIRLRNLGRNSDHHKRVVDNLNNNVDDVIGNLIIDNLDDVILDNLSVDDLDRRCGDGDDRARGAINVWSTV